MGATCMEHFFYFENLCLNALRLTLVYVKGVFLHKTLQDSGAASSFQGPSNKISTLLSLYQPKPLLYPFRGHLRVHANVLDLVPQGGGKKGNAEVQNNNKKSKAVIACISQTCPCSITSEVADNVSVCCFWNSCSLKNLCV